MKWEGQRRWEGSSDAHSAGSVLARSAKYLLRPSTYHAFTAAVSTARGSAGSAGPPEAGVLAGDIVVSTETARRMARAVGWTPRQELAYYIVHGVLHLTGYNDHTAADRRQMRARERAVMKACGLPVPPRTKAAGTPP